MTPLLAEKWTFSPDLETLTFDLRHGVNFQDGETFTSKDVKFSFERAAAKDSTNKDKAFFASIESIDASDPDVVTLKFKAPSFQALYHLGLNTAVILDEKSAPGEATNPVGTGPYKFVAWNKGASATLEKWDGFRDAAKDRDQARHFPFHQRSLGGDGGDAGGRRRRLPALPRRAERRPVQGRSALPGADRRHRGQDDPRRQQQEASRSTICACVRRSPMRSTARRSSTATENGLAPPIGSHLTPNDPGYVDLTGAYPHDPEKAKALLKEAGVTTPLQVTLTLPPPDYARKGGEIIAAELAEVGVQAKIENVEWAQWLSGVYKGKNFDLTIISHVEPLDIGVYANPDYYFQYDSQAFRDIFARIQAAPNLDALQGGARRRPAPDRQGLRQRLPLPVSRRDRRRRASAGLVEERADLRQRRRRDVVASRERRRPP